MDAIERIRNSVETQVQDLFQRLQPENRRRVEAAIDRFGSVAAIPESVWREIEAGIQDEAAAAMLLLLVSVYGSEVRRTARQVGKADRTALNRIAADRDRIEQASRDIATQLGREVASGYTTGVRNKLLRRVDGKADELNRLDQAEARRRISEEVDTATGSATGDGVAVTATTKGVTTAQGSAGSDIGRGLVAAEVFVYWETERDARVCPICRPLHGVEVSKWGETLRAASIEPETIAAIVSQQGPPAHINCRCRLRHRLRVRPATGGSGDQRGRQAEATA